MNYIYIDELLGLELERFFGGAVLLRAYGRTDLQIKWALELQCIYICVCM